MKTKLLGSAGSFDDLIALIEKFYCGTKIQATQGERLNIWHVLNSDGRINGVRIIYKAKRYRFEMVQS